MTRLFITPRRQEGVVAIIVAVSIAVLVGFAGLALDLGKLYVTKSELQAGADACALAAARELTGTSTTQLTIAEAAGITVGAGNRVMFQSEAVSLTASDNVTFSPTLNGAYVVKDGLSEPQILAMKFARCTVDRSDIASWLIHALNALPGIDIGPQTVAAMATASVVAAQTNCALPVALCSADLAGKPVGTWLQGALGPPGNTLTGNFMWIDFTPPGGGAAELAAILRGQGACNIPAVGAEVGQPGNIASIADDWNTRFGIYSPPLNSSRPVPDFTGYAYTEAAGSWPSQFNAYDDFVTRRSTNAPYQGNTPTGLNILPNATIADAAYLGANGADRRMAVVPVVDCTGFVSGSTAPLESWACILMLHPLNTNSGGGSTGTTRMFLEYRGPSNVANSPCATMGLPGGPTSVGPLVAVLVQ